MPFTPENRSLFRRYVMQNSEKNAVLGGTLYLVGTPIGNLSDLSDRAKKVLSEVDFIAAEDTRVTGKLLSFLGVRRETLSYYEHNRAERGVEILRRLLAGESCALVTDAGMPAISDPGQDLVSLCADHNVPVTVIPGPCAAVCAVALSGLPVDHFYFEGFLPRTNRERQERLSLLCQIPAALILYEAPHRIPETLADLAAALGDRRCTICRELTKLNEEILRTTLSRAATLCTESEPRGEYVIVIDGSDAVPFRKQNKPDLNLLSPGDHVSFYEAQGKKRMDAIKAAAADRGMTKSEFYRLTVEKKDE